LSALSSSATRASTTGPRLISVAALEMNTFEPSSSQPSSCRLAVVRMPLASEPAPVSVRPNDPSFSPVASGRSQRSFCASDPNAISGIEPIVKCACHAAAIDWSILATSKSAATSATVDTSVPPCPSGASRPMRSSSPMRANSSTGQRSSSYHRAAFGAISPWAKSRTRSRSERSSSVRTGRGVATAITLLIPTGWSTLYPSVRA
jgi:hypothetical protein